MIWPLTCGTNWTCIVLATSQLCDSISFSFLICKMGINNKASSVGLVRVKWKKERQVLSSSWWMLSVRLTLWVSKPLPPGPHVPPGHIEPAFLSFLLFSPPLLPPLPYSILGIGSRVRCMLLKYPTAMQFWAFGFPAWVCFHSGERIRVGREERATEVAHLPRSSKPCLSSPCLCPGTRNTHT